MHADFQLALKFLLRYALQHCEVPYVYKCMHCREAWDLLNKYIQDDGIVEREQSRLGHGDGA